jgi:hypothetical protein
MDRLSSFAVDPVATQLALLNLLLFVNLCCKGIGYATAIFMRRDPPKKSTRGKVAQSGES